VLPGRTARITGVYGPSTDSMSRQNDLRSVIRESQLGTGVPSSLLAARFGWHLFRNHGVRRGRRQIGGAPAVVESLVGRVRPTGDDRSCS